MSKTTVVNKKISKYDVYIGRSQSPRHFGNPYSHLQVSAARVIVKTREEAVQKFELWLAGKIDLWLEPERRRWILKKVPALKGKKLGCFCKPLSCHGDVLAKLANEP